MNAVFFLNEFHFFIDYAKGLILYMHILQLKIEVFLL